MADTTGLSANTISNIENDRTQAIGKNGVLLKSFYEGCGIEFLPHDGVRTNPGSPVYEGPEGFRRFYDDIYETVRDSGGDICLFNGVPAFLIKWLGKEWYAMHAQRMTAIADNFDFRVIIREQDRQLIGASFAQYRWFPEELFQDHTIYVYGDKTAFLRFSEDNVIAEVRKDAQNANVMRVLFSIAWDHVAREIEQ